jgi:hypothetical protein
VDLRADGHPAEHQTQTRCSGGKGGQEEVVDCVAVVKKETYGPPWLAQLAFIHLISFGGCHAPE